MPRTFLVRRSGDKKTLLRPPDGENLEDDVSYDNKEDITENDSSLGEYGIYI